MNEQNGEAVIILCKCGRYHKAYGIRTENIGNNWICTWAFPIKEGSAKREGYDKTSIKGSITFANEYPGCPYCGGNNLTVCSCGHLNCTMLKDGRFTCEWCGAQGEISDYTGEETIAAGSDV